MKFVVIALLVFITYFPALRNEFVYDDVLVIQREYLSFNKEGIVQAFREPHYAFLPYYRPIARLTFIFQKHYWGDDTAIGYHLFNLILIVLTGWMSFLLLKADPFSINSTGAFIGSLMYVLHPIASSVVYPAASGRETLLPGLFLITAFYHYIKTTRKSFFLSLGFFLLAIFAKEQAVIFPLICFGYDLLFRKKQTVTWLGILWRWFLLLIVSSAYFYIRWDIFRGREFDVQPNLTLVLATPLYALQHIITPFVELRYEPNEIVTWISWPRTIISLGITLMLLYLGGKQKKIRLKIFFWAYFFIVTLLPNANLLKQEALFDERYLFLSWFGLIGIMLTVTNYVLGIWRSLLVTVGICLILVLATISHHRGTFFNNNLVFTKQWAHTSPNHYLAHYNYARSLQEIGDLSGAAWYYQKSTELNPAWVTSIINLGTVYFQEQRYSDAAVQFLKLLELEPNSPKAMYYLGVTYFEMGDRVNATLILNRLIDLDPDYAPAYDYLMLLNEQI